MHKKKFWSIDVDQDDSEYWCKLPFDENPDDNPAPWRRFDKSILEMFDRYYTELHPQYLEAYREIRPHLVNVIGGKEKPVPSLAKSLRRWEEIF